VRALVKVSLTVNGERLEGDAWGGESLLTFLRDTLELPGSKNACEQGECGSCSVLFDGTLVCSCLVLAAQADGHAVVTVEGLAREEALHPVQQAFVDAGAVQCGFCTPGLVVATAALLERVPEHVLTVIDEAYFQYVEDPSFPDAIEEAAKRGRNVLALRTFSKIFGLAGLRIGYGVGPAGVVSAMRKVQRAFDVTTPAQEAALASLDDDAELERRRAVNRDAMAALEAVLREHGFDPISPAVGNFLFVDVGEDAAALDQRLLRRGVIVRPMGSFGAPSALRITAGTPEEIAFLAEQLDAVLVPEAGRIPVS